MGLAGVEHVGEGCCSHIVVVWVLVVGGVEGGSCCKGSRLKAVVADTFAARAQGEALHCLFERHGTLVVVVVVLLEKCCCDRQGWDERRRGRLKLARSKFKVLAE